MPYRGKEHVPTVPTVPTMFAQGMGTVASIWRPLCSSRVRLFGVTFTSYESVGRVKLSTSTGACDMLYWRYVWLILWLMLGRSTCRGTGHTEAYRVRHTGAYATGGM